jgi:hypothetical protein
LPKSVPVFNLKDDLGTTEFAANIQFPSAGTWKLQVVGEAGSQPFEIGNPITIQIFQSTADWIRSKWEIIAALSGAIYIVGFALLFVLAHWYERAFRILTDPLWSKVGIWPFFVLRHWFPAQRWVLEPWFRAVAKSIPTDHNYLNVPIYEPVGLPIEATALLRRLQTNSRLWLHGRIGMGKSAVFQAWERAYYLESGSLVAAVQKFGFILVSIPVRQVAHLPIDANRPDSWVTQAVMHRLSQFGLDLTDSSLAEALLKTGGIAVSLDGMNEADRELSVVVFGRLFARTRLLVTSQGEGPKEFEMWRLPQEISENAKALLQLWMGVAEGDALWARLVQTGLMRELHSGYDLRLIDNLHCCSELRPWDWF